MTERDDSAVARSARRKVLRRLLPLLLAMYVVAYLDRANAGFAKLQMQEKLQFTDSVFGLGLGLFFIGYLILEIPGALLVEHWSARKWFARILVTWGACSMAMALVRTPEQFYLARFLLGLAEAGFFPGVIVYFTHWFPRRERATAMAWMFLAVPGSMALGAPVSALLLGETWFGLDGWQLVFLVEGAPAVLLGIAIPFLLPDRPRDANWLTAEERDWLVCTLDDERRDTVQAGNATLGHALRQTNVWLLALGILTVNIGGYGVIFWLSTLVKGLLKQVEMDSSNTATLLWTGLVFFCGMIGILAAGWSSDRHGERKWHCVAGLLGAGAFFSLAAVPGQPWAMVMLWLCIAGFASAFWIPPYWVLPTLAMTSSAAAVSIGVINICANTGGYIGNHLTGYLRDAGLTDAENLAMFAGCYATGGLILAFIRVTPHASQPLETTAT